MLDLHNYLYVFHLYFDYFFLKILKETNKFVIIIPSKDNK